MFNLSLTFSFVCTNKRVHAVLRLTISQSGLCVASGPATEEGIETQEIILNQSFFQKKCCFQTGQIHVDNKLRDIQCRMDRGERVRGGLLTGLVLGQELSREEIYANMTEMLLAGVDTVSGPAVLFSHRQSG